MEKTFPSSRSAIALILTIDSFAWIELLRGSPLAPIVRTRMNEADHCVTHSICFAEVASFGLKHGMEKDSVLRNLEQMLEAAQVVETDPELAVAAAEAALELKGLAKSAGLPAAGLADGLILATSRRFKSKVLTGDRHFRGLPETMWLE